MIQKTQNLIGLSDNKLTADEIEFQNRTENAAVILQALYLHCKISVCQSSHLRTEDCTP